MTPYLIVLVIVLCVLYTISWNQAKEYKEKYEQAESAFKDIAKKYRRLRNTKG